MATNGAPAGRRALVLGGGGLLGIAWETGLLGGLAKTGIDPAEAELIVGTSAGAVVGAQLASGSAIDEMVADQFKPRDFGVATSMEFDLANVMSLFQKWAAYHEITQADRVEIGAMALASKTASEERWVASFEPLVPEEWPAGPLLLTAVEAKTGQFQVWNRESGVPLLRAVASSCAVPGLFPPVTINGRPYIDGGVRSGTNADLAGGYRNVLIIAPIGARAEGIDPLLGRQARAEAEALRAGGSAVELAFPDAEGLEAIGINRMDPTRRATVTEAGVLQGKALAARLREVWVAAAT